MKNKASPGLRFCVSRAHSYAHNSSNKYKMMANKSYTCWGFNSEKWAFLDESCERIQHSMANHDCSGLNFQSALKRHSISNHREDRSAFKLCVCVNVCACVNVCCVLECIRFSLDVAEIFPEHCDTLQPDSNQAKEWGRRGDHRATEEPEAAWLKWGTTTQANGRRGGLHIEAPHMAATWVMSNLSFSFLAKPAVTNLISLPGNKKDFSGCLPHFDPVQITSMFWPFPICELLQHTESWDEFSGLRVWRLMVEESLKHFYPSWKQKWSVHQWNQPLV